MSARYYDGGSTATGQKVMLATTAYDSPDAGYTFSIQKSREALTEAGIQSAYFLLSGNCHVDDARNFVVQEFLLSDCTDLIFLDADVSWEPKDLITLCGYESDVVGGVYPFRRDDEKARRTMPVRMIQGNYEPKDGLLEVEGLPAGFMRISRHVLERLDKTSDRFWDHDDRRSMVPIIFERTFEDGNRYGGDITFCRKCRALGFKVSADFEMRLGHTAKAVIWDSLGAGLRRQSGTTLAHVAARVRDGGDDLLPVLSEARRFCANHYGALEDVLMLSVVMARKAEEPILEIGSGLSTILMAAATEQMVYCIEHDPGWAAKLHLMAHQAGVFNIAICKQPILNGWYDLSDIELPKSFALALVDGPPRIFGSRMPFYDRLAERCDVIVVDDMDDPGYRQAVEDWAGSHDWRIDFVEERAALIRKMERKAA